MIKIRLRDPGAILRIVALILFALATSVTALILAAFLLLGPGEFSHRLSANVAPQPAPTPTLTVSPLATPIAAGVTTLRSASLGVTMDYPADWFRYQTGVRLILSPDADEPDLIRGNATAFWIGLPPADAAGPPALLTDALSPLPANTRRLNAGQVSFAGQTWHFVEVVFEDERGLSGHVRLLATVRNDVGYVLGLQAPAAAWDALFPLFRGMLNSFHFTTENVLRPTDATLPPTPTPTPTPRIYVVQPGDTLSQIALRFNVSVEALMARNGIEDPRYLRTGQRLIIPNLRRR